MLIYPAIDLMNGRCVRLSQGRFDDATVYDAPPEERLRDYAAAGAEWAHLVDLDGAKAGAPRQHALLRDLAARAPLKTQVAGGVRAREHIAGLLDAGADRVVVGSRAAEDPDAVCGWLAEFGGERVALAFDVRFADDQPRVALKGWRETSSLTLDEALARYDGADLRHVLVTNIARDGMMNGPDTDLYEKTAARKSSFALQASGGVRNIADITALKKSEAPAAIIGRALYEGALDLKEAIRAGA